jgi:hypothetical protein
VFSVSAVFGLRSDISATASRIDGSEAAVGMKRRRRKSMVTETEPEAVLAARSAILQAIQDNPGIVTLPPDTVAVAFPGRDRTERCEMLLYWAETHGLDVKSHKACDPDEMCDEWPCGPIDFEGRVSGGK